MKKGLTKISEKEKQIMGVLWSSIEPLTASAVVERDENLNINTVQVGMRSLMKKGYIEIADIVYSGTVLSRCYRPLISAEEYAANELQNMRTGVLNFSTMNFINYLSKNDETDILNELEDIIKKMKKERGE